MTDPVEDYRLAMSRLISGVCVISARAGSLDLAMTATSVVSVSLEPPTVLFCVHSDARLAEAVQPGGTWGVSILSAAAGAVADWLASPGRPAVGQLDRVGHHRGEHSGTALLDEATAWLQCRTEWTKEAGSHEVVVGQVLSTALAPAGSGGIVHHLGRMRAAP
ncbi:flavin reductase family protein [Pseudactinotalea sp. Z1739]|uniref:flavin reductase family protein n=1 Tax=Pseudactinotalea sp. Z1739 TaxID=3413028 RepID=UPI003C7D91C3